jgi:uncharacterized protein
MGTITNLILKNPVKILILFVLVTIGSIFLQMNLRFDISIFNIFDKSTPKLNEILEINEIFGDNTTGLVVVAYKDENLFTHDGLKKLERLTNEMESVDQVKSVVSFFSMPDFSSGDAIISGTPFIDREDIPTNPKVLARLRENAVSNPLLRNQIISPDGKAVAVVVFLPELDMENDPAGALRQPIIKEIREKVSALSKETGTDFQLSGVPVIGDEYSRLLKSDLSIFIIGCCIVLSLILVCIFRSFRGVGIPVVTVLTAAGWTVALMAALDHAINMINSSLPALVMVIGCADSIHIMGRYTEDLGKGLCREDALQKTFRHIGVAILLTSVTSSIGFLSLSTSSSWAVRDLGQFAAAGIFFAYIASITFIPAVLAILKPEPSMPRVVTGPDIFERALLKIVSINTTRPKTVLFSGVLLLSVSLLGIYLLKTDSRILQELDPKSEIAKSTYFIEDNLGGVLNLDLVITAPEGKSAADKEMLDALWALHTELNKYEGVGNSVSLASYMAAMNRAFAGEWAVPENQRLIDQFFFLFEDNEDSFQIYDYIDVDKKRLRVVLRMHDLQREPLVKLVDKVEKYCETSFPEGSGILLTGGMLMAKEVTGGIVKDLVSSLLMAFCFIFIITVVLFKSIRLGILSIVPNILPLLVCMGVMGIFDIRLRVSTAMIFAIALGIAVDDTIHFLNRYRVERNKGKSIEEAVVVVLMTTGRAITQTTILLVLGLMVLMAGSFKATTHFAILSATIFSAAFFASMFLLPAALVLSSKLKK